MHWSVARPVSFFSSVHSPRGRATTPACHTSWHRPCFTYPVKHGTAYHLRAGGTTMPDQHFRSQFFLPLWLLIGVGLMLVLPSVWDTSGREQLSYSDFKTMLRQGRVAQVQI